MLGLILSSLAIAMVGYQTTQLLRPIPSLQGKSVVIVGASTGIGRSLALEYARGGAELLICARRAAELEKVASECRALSGQAVHKVIGDITLRKTQIALRNVAAETMQDGVDYLVLNAGAISVQQIIDLWDMRNESNTGLRDIVQDDAVERADQAMRQIMEVNVMAPVVLAGLFLPMVAKSRGSIVVLSSMTGLIAAPTRSLYSASKHAVSAYFSALRMEVHRLGVAVTVAYPGTVDTDLRQSAVDKSSATVAGSSSGKISPQSCAQQIVRAAALRQPTLITPLPYRISVWLYSFAPGFVEYMAKRKYGPA
ncbi:hypothetical protein H4R24_001998 [Coemansia sp. RSA 988]|nr:hypothetical protein H4R24_001998 [Coemansia sp. RSA 988]